MKYGVSNNFRAKVVSIKEDEIMAQLECQLVDAPLLQSVITRDALEEMNLKPGDEIQLLIKSVSVLPVKN